jgi:transposase
MTSASCDERLFEAPPAREGGAVPRPAAAKTFRSYDPDQVFLMPPSLDDWLPEDHPARFVSELVDEMLDLTPIFASYTEASGAPPYHPRLMLKLVIYAYATGVTSSREIERRCATDVAFRFLSGNAAPDYRSISRFRRRHLKAIKALFVQVLQLCGKAGLVKLGRVAIDGTKVRAAASRHKAMSYDRMVKRHGELEAEVEALLGEAERVDTEEDERFGPDRRGDEVPAELARRESRLAKLREAKEALEAEAREKAAAEAAQRAQARGDSPEAQAEAAARAAEKAAPKPKAQRNFTDPESRIMKMADGSFHQCFNGQVAAVAGTGVIVGAQMSNVAPDVGHLLPVLDDVINNCGAAPRQAVADAGYWSEDNAAGVAERDVDGYIATGRTKHNEPVPPAPRGRIPKNATPKERMARKLRTKRGKAIYARRKVDVEPVIGQMKGRQNAGRVRLRGLDGASGEWLLHCLCHNVLKLHGTGPRPSPANP